MGIKKQIVYKKIDEIHPYANNPRFNDDAVKYVANSIKEFGFQNPMIIKSDGEIICGHTRYKAALELGLTEVPCVIADDLTDEQIKAFRLADNKVSEFADWNFDLLDLELDDIIDIDMEKLGFEKQEEKEEDEEIEGEIEFAEVLGEEHNYIVLYFDNEVDWLQAESLFDIKPVKCGSTRKDRRITEKMSRVGIGRVIKGSEAINKILGEKYEDIN